MNRPILLIGGPTGVGKNQLAKELALLFPGEIVNADSRQIYRELSIGTNQPSDQDKKSVPHHLYDFLEPSTHFSAAEYERLAIPVIDRILTRRRLPIIVGGTGFYMKALLKGVWATPPKDAEMNRRLNKISTRHGNAFAHRMLSRLDPVSAGQIAINDKYRVIRALEIFFQTGKRRSEVEVVREEQFDAGKFFLDQDRDVLNENIRKRTQQMFEKGWVEEVRGLLLKYPNFEQMPAGASLGYPEIIRYIRGDLGRADCEEIIVLKTKQYAKRQLTWFRNQDQFIRLNSQEGLYKMIESVLQLTGDIVKFFSES
jgi:tRNA dimethylallyltransferase